MAKRKRYKKTKDKEKKEGEKRYKMLKPDLDPMVKRWIGVIFLFGLAVLSGLAIFGAAGRLGGYLKEVLTLIFGWGSFLLPIILILLGYYILTREGRESRAAHYIGLFLLVVSFLGVLHLFFLDEGKEIVQKGVGGGYIGYGVSYALEQVMGFWASLVVLIVLFMVSLLIIFEPLLVGIKNRYEERGGFLGPESFWARIKYRLKGGSETNDTDGQVNDTNDEGEGEELGDEEDVEQEIKKSRNQEIRGKEMDIRLGRRKRARIDLPMDLLKESYDKPKSGDVEKNKMIIQKTLENFGILVEMGEVKVGPTVTQYTLRPAEGVKLSRIVTLQNDLALALAAHPIRIEAPIPGKSLVGIEIPNEATATVVLRELLETEEFKRRESKLTFGLGQDVAGHPWLVRLDKLPHLLVAGATGSGKSVCLNSIIVSLLYQNSSEELKFILVDPKRVELTMYNGIPHLLTPVITDVSRVIRALKWTVGEMERRFHILSEAGKRDIRVYNRDRDRLSKDGVMPYIIFAIDELADLMTAAGAEVEGLIIRLAQMSRAVGIHLILATQRPSVDIITGLIKANIPSRIAFFVASITDSRTILDMGGAEKLLGRGDMLYISPELSKPKRLQGAYLSDKEIENVIRYLRERSEPDYNEEIVETILRPGDFGLVSGVEIEDEDELLEEAKEVVFQAGKASASLLQRRLRIGYARAARILDLLEEQGIVGPADGARPREVNVGQSLTKFNKVEDVEEEGGEEIEKLETDVANLHKFTTNDTNSDEEE